MESSDSIFSFHLFTASALENIKLLLNPLHKKVPGLNHSESFLIMRLGETIHSSSRYKKNQCALFSYWNKEESLEQFLSSSLCSTSIRGGWHVRMKLYRRWGEVSQLKGAQVNDKSQSSMSPTVAVTLARLKLLQTSRFTHWGIPVERQVRDHTSQVLALAAIRPLNTFSTFSIWRDEDEMTSMVNQGSHLSAMKERNRKPFHYEFTTMRFFPTGEFGEWNGKSNYIS